MIDSIKKTNRVLPKEFRFRAILVLLLSLLNSLLELLGLASLFPLFSILIREDAIMQNPSLLSIYSFMGFSSTNQFILSLIGFITFVIIAKNIISLYIIRYQAKFSFDLMEYLTLESHEHFFSKGFLFLKNNNSNTIYRNIYTIPQSFANSIIMGLINLMNELVVLTIIIVTIAWYDITIMMLLMLTVIPIFTLFYIFTKKKNSYIGEETNRISPLLSRDIFQSIHGYTDVTVTNSYRFFYERIEKNLEIFKRLNILRVVLVFAPTKLIESSMVLAIFIVTLYGLYFLPDKESLLTLLSIFGISAYRVMPSINRIIIAMGGIVGYQYTFDILGELNRSESIVRDNQEILFKRQILLKNISFSYPKSKIKAIENFSLTIKKGESIGIVGKSGSGKSTLINILLGFIVPDEGMVWIDNQALNENTLSSWQKKIGYVEQDLFLLDASLAENIAFGLEKSAIDLERLKHVVELSRLTELVQSLPNGIETSVGEKGSQLSGGQRQRVAIARALYYESEVLLFDEATSALDIQTQKEVIESIRLLSERGLTMIIISHAKNSLIYVDRVINLDPKG